MSSRPPVLLLLLLTGLLLIWPCARGQSSWLIDTVGLSVLPSSTVQSGTTVRIRCRVIVSHSDSPDLTHTFQITRNGADVHTLDTTKDSVEYVLNQTRAADSGTYRCHVTVRGKQRTKDKSSTETKLNVIGLQTPTLHLDNPSPYENEEFKATCRAPGEKGSLLFRFYQRLKHREPQLIYEVMSSGNTVKTTLALSHIGEASLYCDCGIRLTSGTQRSNSSTEIQVLVRALNITPIMTVIPSTDVYEGDVLEVTCKVEYKAREGDNFELFLKKGGRILKSTNITILIHRLLVQENLSGELECKAERGNVQKETYIPITAKERFSKPRLTVWPEEIFEGDEFRVTCTVSINDTEKVTNMRTYLYVNGVKVADNASYSVTANAKTNGNYTCRAQPGVPLDTIIKESEAKVVKAKVPVSSPVLRVVGDTLVLGKQFQLLCHSQNGTLPITYILHGPNRETQIRNVNKPGEAVVFNTSAIFKSTDLSSFLCRARNSENRPTVVSGQQLLRSTTIIEPVSKPVLSVRPDVSGISEGNNVTLLCSLQRGSAPINFTWYNVENKRPLYSETSNKLEGTYRLNHVHRLQGGKYFCVSTNPAHEPKQSNAVTISVKLAAWKRGLIAVSCILFLLILLLVFAFKTRLLHFKRKRTGNLSVKSVGTKAERLSLTQAEVNEAANVTPGMMGKSIWSEHLSGSDSDEQNNPEKTEVQYAEVQARRADPNRVPERVDTATVYSEVRNSQQGVPDPADSVSSVTYTLRHKHCNRNEHSSMCCVFVQRDVSLTDTVE
ncbi:platelet endothelial cell adhesion molecule isoform X2 [Mugil cephalus]|uniref:platelet endothelial cell adhesion molecule isoform X2 n=1 Tax=Mugil cephalus TaxID=48193 RepID=UPI001FB6252A|nr:platelet endothelial cell adhesion molecule isoform X2 [Mugil cephalus]